MLRSYPLEIKLLFTSFTSTLGAILSMILSGFFLVPKVRNPVLLLVSYLTIIILSPGFCLQNLILILPK